MKHGSIEKRLSQALLQYRITPHASTGIPPCNVLFNRRVKTRLDLVRPSPRMKVEQQQQQARRNPARPHHGFEPGDPVLVANFQRGPKWVPAVVVERLGSVNYRC